MNMNGFIKRMWGISRFPLHLSVLFLIVVVGSPLDLPAGEIPPMEITCLGDSVTAGVGASSPDMKYPPQMAILLDSAYDTINFDVVNRGVGGDTADMLYFRLTQENLLDGDDPDFILLMIGGNDLNGGGGIDETVQEIQDTVNWLNSNTTSKIIVSTFIPNLLYGTLGSWWISLFNNTLQNQLNGYDMMITTNWVDIYDSSQGHAKTWLMSDDVHPNDQGYTYLAANFFDALGTFPSFIDTDSDGLWDAEEDIDGDGVWDEGVETNFNNGDTDGDNISDYIEVTCAGMSTALDQYTQPSTIRLNFQPVHSIVPGGFMIDRGGTFSSGKGFGWQ